MATHLKQLELLYTPRRAQKCLFASDGNSCKKNLSRDLSYNKDIEATSGEDSDLGPMSPLALTDRSPNSCGSSPGREFVSPLATPEKSPSLPMASWDRLISYRRNTEDYTSLFNSLKKLSREARYSPRCNTITNQSFPRSMSPSPVKETSASSTPSTPKCSEVDAMADEIIPETPQRSCATDIQNQSITETPRKSGTPSPHRLITPLGSITKSALLPKLHRRKSLGTFEANENFSPEQKEKTLKRHARDQLLMTPAKLFKADDSSAPRARAALFQEKKTEAPVNNISLSTKMFYSSGKKSERPFVVNSLKNNDVKRRRSLPIQSSSSSRCSLKKQRFGMINAGVFHGIKKPKTKVNLKVLKKEGQQVTQSPAESNENKENKNPLVEQALPMEANATTERTSSPEIDESRRFFKTIKPSQTATVTVNKRIKLKIADGKILLNQKHGFYSTNACNKQRAKAKDVSCDATDLTVDEPSVETTLEGNKVANILKILEDDWANDDYDTMETLTVNTNTVSSPTTTLAQDAIMSPASELSNMTSTMNIRDVTSLTSFGSLSLSNTNNNPAKVDQESEEKYYPLFTKRYAAPSADFSKETGKINKSTREKRNTQWQLSVKNGQDQYQLDAGQKHFGATQCPECNIVYQLGDAEDENAHLNYHNSIRTLKFQGWKNERVMMENSFTGSRIILVESHDPKQYWKKVSEILAVVDRDLGLADMKLCVYENKKVYLYIREKSVLGVLVAEHIKTAHRMIPELIELDCCTAESTPAKCGINVVWTAMSHRKQGIATRLVNTLRAKFFYGYVMSLDDIAFSTPSLSGKIFAEKYTKTRNFKVYS
ncbi:N-acetyltransferase ESCO2 [Harpegnathos saltator]|uniref:N-acetyltransferase ESCO2 n=1 Tax=Harpegnathos saltator TaxID=610380 RepID=E2BLC8_HARSA|nr:N-acetyltransferase ESCO2 [Harpegnathos saltator]EFN83480.1 N-acetyltransferase ESCO2 [Harpegnathos saltator]